MASSSIPRRRGVPADVSPHRAWYEPSAYVIRVQGVLRASWSDRLGGMRITPDESNAGCTVLQGVLPDQAALLGILEGLYDLGMLLLLVECVEGDAGAGSKQSGDAPTSLVYGEESQRRPALPGR